MNEQLAQFARQTLKDGLQLCTSQQNHMFKLMYANRQPELTIDQIVDNMEEDKLDWAMQQVQNSIKSIIDVKERGKS